MKNIALINVNTPDLEKVLQATSGGISVKDKFIKPTPKEITFNPRSRSAVLRVAEKLC